MNSRRSYSIVLGLVCVFVFSTTSWGRTDFEFDKVLYHTCYDGDTCMISLPDVHPFFGDHILIRIDGIDTPEIKGKCEREQRLAREARDFLRSVLEAASTIRLTKAHRDKYFRVDATVLADGVDVADLMVNKGYAVRYDGGTKTANWCTDMEETLGEGPPTMDLPSELPTRPEFPSPLP